MLRLALALPSPGFAQHHRSAILHPGWPQGQLGSLENQLQRDLNLPIVVGGRPYSAEGRCPEGGAGVTERRRVEEIEKLAAELKRRPFFEVEVLKERRVEINQTGSAQNVPAGVAIGVLSRVHEITGNAMCMERRAIGGRRAHNTSPFRPTRRSVGNVARNRDRERVSALDGCYSIHLPATQGVPGESARRVQKEG